MKYHAIFVIIEKAPKFEKVVSGALRVRHGIEGSLVRDYSQETMCCVLEQDFLIAA